MLVSLSSAGRRSRYPGVIAAGGHLQTATHKTYGKLVATMLNRLIPQDDSFAKNTAASRKKSRSFFTRASSRLRFASSSSRGDPEPLKALLGTSSASRTHRDSKLGLMPISKATWRQFVPGWRDSAMASRLNSGLYFLRLDMNTPLAHCASFQKCPQ